jgi:3',5'-cyclic AMP phosphodiesterase CpdA
MRFILLLCALGLAGSMIGCATVEAPAELTGDEPWVGQGEDLTEEVTIIADTQFHESRGTASRSFSKTGDEFVDVTIRSAQQTVGSPDILKATLRETRDTSLVLHLGDALDLSCETEWNLFVEAMKQGRSAEAGPTSWLLAPGNHDGFLAGNLFPKPSGLYVTSYWINICNAGRFMKERDAPTWAHLPKDQLLERYLSLLRLSNWKAVERTNRGSRGLGCTSDGSLCVAYRISKSEPWTSYVVQLVRIPSRVDSKPAIYALLLDTSAFADRPYWPLSWAGISGAIGVPQLSDAATLIDALPTSEARFFVGTHHPLSALDVARQGSPEHVAWSSLVSDARSLRFVVSAHTHEGGWYLHKADGAEGVRELNVGSLIDAPVSMRKLRFKVGARGEIAVASERRSLTDLFAGRCESFVLPGKDELHSLERQQPESERHSQSPRFVRAVAAVLSAVSHFFNLWRAKHEEVNAQLLVYAEIVERTMPDGHQLKYWPFGDSGGAPLSRAGGRQLAQEMRRLANSTETDKLYSVQAKGNLLLALERYYWHADDTPRDVVEAAHLIRTCVALKAATATPQLSERGRLLVKTVDARSARSGLTLISGRP